MVLRFKEGERVFISKDSCHSSDRRLGTIVRYTKLYIRDIPVIFYLVRFKKLGRSFWYKDSEILKNNYPYLF